MDEFCGVFILPISNFCRVLFIYFIFLCDRAKHFTVFPRDIICRFFFHAINGQFCFGERKAYSWFFLTKEERILQFSSAIDECCKIFILRTGDFFRWPIIEFLVFPSAKWPYANQHFHPWLIDEFFKTCQQQQQKSRISWNRLPNFKNIFFARVIEKFRDILSN